MDPEVVERPAEELQLLPVQLEELGIVGLEAGIDPALGEVLEQSLLVRSHD